MIEVFLLSLSFSVYYFDEAGEGQDHLAVVWSRKVEVYRMNRSEGLSLVYLVFEV